MNLNIGPTPEISGLNSVTSNLCMFVINYVRNVKSASGCGSVGRVVASDTRGPQFESSHWQNLY